MWYMENRSVVVEKYKLFLFKVCVLFFSITFVKEKFWQTKDGETKTEEQNRCFKESSYVEARLSSEFLFVDFFFKEKR